MTHNNQKPEAKSRKAPTRVGSGDLLGGVDSSSKCDNSEEVALQTFLFRRKPLLPVG
jgi:hypothetical protein